MLPHTTSSSQVTLSHADWLRIAICTAPSSSLDATNQQTSMNFTKIHPRWWRVRGYSARCMSMLAARIDGIHIINLLRACANMAFTRALQSFLYTGWSVPILHRAVVVILSTK
ncbi:hypothetical protein EJ05DRAFT_154566 [Pseudovirgaria hyperparasitica]|uniref:Uncharacterized protein n=1 Tax=Pseudovirgaria hyperparasitica TaxID=470096 RepID=A0A6A6VUA3_9PEZI|nr:uncharacterized protein EJ05DRAFT_154566 [Pseudovirgaria hyperparasitica]KAF2754268.1 hypothetical protein EJ05DRAFT_154566 [Pseudovirgaria hyperparasitica]